VQITINIHWGEFYGAAERTEIHFPIGANPKEIKDSIYQYYMLLRGYLPFTLLKNYTTKQWIDTSPAEPSISKQVIFYARKIIDEFEIKNKY
jgi:hypothetical protein